MDTGSGGDINQIIGLDCRVLVAGAMFKKAIIYASDGWDEFVKNVFPNKGLIKPDDEALNKRIKWQLS
ncbi:unnamed protein product [marine sediment metagenome]|uniref:Uncharacterized protein n=1 Tax=marine sediment metagenome TaxID=412755 RepID=X1NG23_9ZZZZ